ncbi:GNAT family N-acetyltransferase [Asticcacaulis sp. 201]|uniref:GNAT family N-acetyltransferase n=1 Tax=Asticcacaulis sp. 201 TaxID=3028787 RepID=UPI0029162D6C|nr:GNAT family N-acetyltransferase [Asticcacaulis sp. 201]MDV6332622.1 GNAT family N-acetyltransferase [Asticcacaulis sp. 201]
MARTIRIRRIDVDELEIVRELALVIWPKCYRNIIGPDRVDAMLAVLYATDNLEREMVQDGHIFWVVRVDRTDVGYASAYRDGGRLWLKKLYVRDEFRGLGLGKALMETALAHFASEEAINAPDTATELALYVNKDNEPAISYYLRSGFKVEAEVPVQMGPYVFTDYVMQRAL